MCVYPLKCAADSELNDEICAENEKVLTAFKIIVFVGLRARARVRVDVAKTYSRPDAENALSCSDEQIPRSNAVETKKNSEFT